MTGTFSPLFGEEVRLDLVGDQSCSAGPSKGEIWFRPCDRSAWKRGPGRKKSDARAVEERSGLSEWEPEKAMVRWRSGLRPLGRSRSRANQARIGWSQRQGGGYNEMNSSGGATSARGILSKSADLSPSRLPIYLGFSPGRRQTAFPKRRRGALLQNIAIDRRRDTLDHETWSREGGERIAVRSRSSCALG